MEKLKEIIENAIKEEEFFYHFYNDLAALTQNEKIKQALLELAQFEQNHKEKLQSLNFEGFIPDKITEIEVADLNILKPVNEFKTLKETLQFAIKQELFAKTLYSSLAQATSDEKAKELLEMLSQEEAKHEQILMEQLNYLEEE